MSQESRNGLPSLVTSLLTLEALGSFPCHCLLLSDFDENITMHWHSNKVQLRFCSCAMLFSAFTPPIPLSIMHYSILAKSAHCTYFHVHSLASQESEKFHNLLQNLIISTNIRGTRQFRQLPLFSSNKIDTGNLLAVVSICLNMFSSSTTFIRNIIFY